MIIVVTLLSHPCNIWRIKVAQGQATVLKIFVFYLVTIIQSIVFVVDLVLTLPSFQMAQSE